MSIVLDKLFDGLVATELSPGASPDLASSSCGV
jgi:hypothetical protein